MAPVWLHEWPETHLYDGSFGELAASHVSGDERALLPAPTSPDARRIRSALPAEAEDGLDVTQYAGDSTALPFDIDQFDITILDNPSQGVLQRHPPLYEATAVTAPGGRIIYRAPNYLAHSDAAAIEALYAIDWEDGTPSLAAILSVNTPGDSRSEDAWPTSGTASLIDFVS